MLPANFDEIKSEHIFKLVTEKTPEGRLLEYKRNLLIESTPDKRELAGDVSAFANAAGGDIIYRISEEVDVGKATGRPEAAVGIEVGGATADDIVRRLHQICQQGLDPAIPGLRVRHFAADGKVFIVVRIPRSWLAPHMVSLDGATRFALRVDNAKIWMDREQIRQAFLFSQSARTRLERFRDERLGRIIAGELSVPLESSWKRVLHVVPIAGLDGSFSVDLSRFFPFSGELPKLAIGFLNIRPNVDGAFLAEDLSGRKCCRAAQVFRSGTIEIIRTGNDAKPPHEAVIMGKTVEAELVEDFVRCSLFYRSESVPAPVVVMLSLLDVKGTYLMDRDYYAHQLRDHVFDRSIVILPELTLQTYDGEAKKLLVDLIDSFWQAGGHRRSPTFNREI
jgi:hypothetical protein